MSRGRTERGRDSKEGGKEESFPVGRKCDGLLVLAKFLCPPETHNMFLMFCGGFYRNFYIVGKIIVFLTYLNNSEDVT